MAWPCLDSLNEEKTRKDLDTEALQQDALGVAVNLQLCAS